MTPQATKDHYRSQQRLKVATLAAARRKWREMGADFDASWRRISPDLLLLTAAAQLRSARDSAAYVPRVLAETNQADDAVAQVVPRAFAGVAADGRSLNGLLYGAVTSAKSAVGNGANATEALAQGGRWLDMTLGTVVADAGRQAAQVAITATPAVTGYVRMLNPPSCPLCAILAGRFYRYSSGFARHPGCDCVSIPASENIAGDLRTDPDALLDAGQVRGLTQAETAALADGADFAQVVNARRGALTDASGRRVTTESTTRRGVFRGQGPRLTPEQIYRDARDRADAIRLLERFGYLR